MGVTPSLAPENLSPFPFLLEEDSETLGDGTATRHTGHRMDGESFPRENGWGVSHGRMPTLRGLVRVCCVNNRNVGIVCYSSLCHCPNTRCVLAIPPGGTNLICGPITLIRTFFYFD